MDLMAVPYHFILALVLVTFFLFFITAWFRFNKGLRLTTNLRFDQHAQTSSCVFFGFNLVEILIVLVFIHERILDCK